MVSVLSAVPLSAYMFGGPRTNEGLLDEVVDAMLNERRRCNIEFWFIVFSDMACVLSSE